MDHESTQGITAAKIAAAGKLMESTVKALGGQHPTPLADALNWLEAKTKSGHYHGGSTRLWETAVKRFADVLDENESPTVEYIHDNIDSLVERWARLNPGKASGTSAAYKSRAVKFLEDYLRWKKAPQSFTPTPTGESSRQKMPAVDKPKAKAKAKVKTDPAPTPNESQSHTSSNPEATPRAIGLRDLPLGPDKEFLFVLPKEPLTVDEISRITAHLLTLSPGADMRLSMAIMQKGLTQVLD